MKQSLSKEQKPGSSNVPGTAAKEQATRREATLGQSAAAQTIF